MLNNPNPSLDWAPAAELSTSAAAPRKRISIHLQAARLAWLCFEFAVAGGRYASISLKFRGDVPWRERARWLKRTAQRITRVLGMSVETTGSPAITGALVANHLSYVDILVIASLVPCRFVCKSEVNKWPLFGFFARCGGTIFVDRNRRSDTARTNDELLRALDSGQVAVLFPEGTSTGGAHVLPFKSSLLEPLTQTAQPVTVAHISYSLEQGSVPDEVCYWRDMTLVPHLWNLLGKRNLHARIRFAPATARPAERKELARQLHRQVLRLREAS